MAAEAITNVSMWLSDVPGSVRETADTLQGRDMKMEIERSEDRGVTIVDVRGVINFGESARRFSAYLEELLNSDVPAVLVDMSGIDSVDSTGLGELVGYLQRFEKVGRRLALYRPHGRILSLLRLTRLDEIFAIYDEKEQAVLELGATD